MQNNLKKINLIILMVAVLSIIAYVAINSRLYPQLLYDIILDTKTMDIKTAIIKEEGKYNQNIYEKNRLLELYGGFAKITDRQELNKIIKLKNGFLFNPVDDIKNQDIKIAAIKRLKNNIKAPFIFISFPDIISNNNSLLPQGKYYNFREQTLEFLDRLKAESVEVYDFASLNPEASDEYKFFKTDHHWTPSFAFDAFKNICGIIENKLNVKIDSQFIDKANYDSIMYEDIFLGTSGKRTGRIYGGIDDFELLIPKFKTDLSLNYGKIQSSGDYRSVLINPDNLFRNFYELNTYKAYLGYDEMDFKLHNNLNTACKKKILLIMDSYSMPLICYMAPCFNEVYAVDLRYKDKDFSVIKYINDINPDMVIMQYSPMGLEDDKCFNIKE